MSDFLTRMRRRMAMTHWEGRPSASTAPSHAGELLARGEILPIGVYEDGNGARQYGAAWPGALMSAAQAFTAPGRALQGQMPVETMQGEALNFAGSVGAGGAMAGAAPAGSLGAFKAWHGSPHKFDRFDMGKIGTGEGAQAYGHGLYFAENRGVAQNYRDTLSGGGLETGFHNIDALLNGQYQGDWAAFKADYAGSSTSIDEAIASVDAAGGPRHTKGAGYLYETTIDAEPEDMLDWDAPLSEQPPRVQALVKELGIVEQPIEWRFNGYNGGYMRKMEGGGSHKIGDVTEVMPGQFRAKIGKEEVGVFGSPDDARSALDKALQARGVDPNEALKMTGKEVYYRIAGRPDDMTHADTSAGSKALRERGIKGIRYLDGGSRGKGDGTRNFVVFDDNLVNIDAVLNRPAPFPQESDNREQAEDYLRRHRRKQALQGYF